MSTMSSNSIDRPAKEGAYGLEHEHTGTEVGQIQGADNDILAELGYTPTLTRNRTLATVLFQSIAIIAVPFGEGTALNTALIGGGQLPYFVGWILVSVLDMTVALSLAELASRFPTAAGPYYWVYRLMPENRSRKTLSFITGWIWLVGNWTIALSVNFGFASLIAGTVTMYHPDWAATPWQLLLIFYAICIGVFAVVAFGNRILPYIDTVAAGWNLICILVVFLGLSISAKAGRHSAADALAYYDTTLSGWGNWGFAIGLLPAAYTYAAFGMITSMAEEVNEPERTIPKALCYGIPLSAITGLFYILPICFTLPPLQDVLNAPAAQGLPYIFHTVMGSPGGGLGLMFTVLGVAAFCSISITTTASRCTWAFARDRALPFSALWARLDFGDTPVMALALTTIVQMLLGLINLGSSSAFVAFVSVGVIGLAAAYAIPVAVSMTQGRQAVSTASFRLPPIIGWSMNVLMVVWILFQMILFSMPATLPVTAVSMNYSSVVFVGFFVLSTIYYVVWARKVYEGPAKSDLA
ncbi:unnamed protein product [Zymoseptoria tritici ST99CH_1A5]|uniref:Amino acid permease/ SLC12A domain-containing protein n=2 Tax=Zymoseptoria tritici TaxID=1047171 RepID=A0A1X7RQ44_ZYMT9|nr:unnamed protein product [Zymoseptoria tritici ST99CH_3D7]SMY23018.1 unnamed protein product [Zymoseptoria tritici ST99CH_1A5]